MEKSAFSQQFSERLRDALLKAEYGSPRSASGVDIQKLSDIMGHSVQICRKYLRGQAIPEPMKLVELAAKLHVSPGWLLFGNPYPEEASHYLSIHKNLLHYIFTEASNLYNADLADDERADFLLDLTRDIAHINTTEEQSKKIIDLALSSAKHFT